MQNELPPSTYRISVKALVTDNTGTKFLLTQENSGKWDLPGGGLVWGELPHEGLKREVREELGLDISATEERPSYFFTITSPEIKYAYVLYRTTVPVAAFAPTPESKSIMLVTADEARNLDILPHIKIFLSLFKG